MVIIRKSHIHSLSRVLVLTLIASLLSAVTLITDAALNSTSAQAAETYRSQTFYYSTSAQTWTAPANATRVRFIMIGGGGGYGGLDCGSGCSYVPPSNAGYVVTDWLPRPTYVAMAVGSAGGGGWNCARWNGGGSPGSNPWGYNGGWGGNAGGYGCSGGGGGGGAATVVQLGGTYNGFIIAGGAGGGGGNGNFGYTSTMVGKSSVYSTGQIYGGNGAGPGGSDGGGGGGGGGGRWGSYGSGVYWAGGEYGGVGGYIGSNGTTMSVPLATNGQVWRANNNGYITIEWYEASFPGAPAAPTVVSRGDGSVSLSWSAPTDSGGTGIGITGYELSLSTGAVCATTNGSTFSGTCTGLVNGTSYNFRVRAQNQFGWGTYSSTVAATPRTVPSTMSAPTATPGNSNASLTWIAPSNGGAAISSYTVQYSTAASTSRSWVNVTGLSGTSSTITGLTNGTPYVFRIWAINEAGSGTASSESSSVIPRTNPGAPTSFAIAGTGDGSVSLSWQLPASNGGLAVTDYIVEFATTASSTFTVFNDGVSTTNSATVTGLTNATAYKFRIKARNSGNLDSVYTSELTATPVTIPGAPASLTSSWPDCSTICSGKINLTWTSPTSNGGSAVTGYTIQVAVKPVSGTPVWSTAATAAANATTISLTGLTNGTTYVYRIAANNAIGISPYREELDGRAPRDLPGTPANLQISSVGNTAVSLSWSAPASDGGTPLTDYKIEYRVSPSGSWTVFTDSVSTSTSVTVTGLTNGTGYQFRVSAINAAGTGASTAESSSATPLTTPAKAVFTGVAQNQSIKITIGSFSNGGSALTSIQYSIDGAASWQNSGVLSGEFTISGLTNGTPYPVIIRGVNLAGAGVSSDSASFTPFTIPTEPADIRITREANASIQISWVAPVNNGGSAITSYEIYIRTGTSGTFTLLNSAAASSTSYTASGLTNGTTYQLQIYAKNAAGNSLAPSATVTGVPRTTPGAPTLNSVVIGNTQLTVNWTAPTDNGGTAITGYNIFYATGGVSRSLSVGNVNSAIITGLVNGTTYAVTVHAISGGGQGSASSSVNGTPAFTPSAPQSLLVTAGVTELAVSWSAPASNGGNAISAYKVERSTDGTNWTLVSDSVSGTSTTITGLTAKTPYYVRVSATNSVGYGPVAQYATTITPFNKPTQPIINETATAAFPDRVDVVFDTTGVDPNGSPVSGYKVYSFLDDASKTPAPRTCTTAVTGSSVTCTVTGLTNKQAYRFAVVAINAAGESVISTYSKAYIPGALNQSINVDTPTAGFKFGDRALSLNATATSGLPVKYSEQSPSICTLVGATSAEKESLGLVFPKAAGECFIRITQAGDATYNPATTVDLKFNVGAIPPTAPTITSARGTADNNLVVQWSAPTSTGGTTLTSYRINLAGTQSETYTVSSILTLNHTFTGLSQGNYSVTVTAINSAGSATSDSVSAVVFVAPLAPTSVTVATGDRSLSISWTRGTDSLATTGYLVQASTTTGFDAIAAECSAAASTSCVITGLLQDNRYYIRVYQSNAYATSPASTTVNNFTGLLSQTLSSISLLDGSSQSISVTGETATKSASAAVNSGPLTLSVALSSNIVPTIATSTSSICSFNSSTNKITLIAAGNCVLTINQSGTGNAYDALPTTTLTISVSAVAPDAPVITGVAPTANAGELRVTWSAPSNNGGSSILDYTVTESSTATSFTGNALLTTFTGLAPGIYSFTVTARNSAGSSLSSAAATYALVVKPSTPTLISVTTADRGLVVVWSPSANNGGSTISGYRVTATSGGVSKICTTNNTSNVDSGNFTCTVSGLLNDSVYTVSVVADNSYYLSDADSAIDSTSSWTAGNIAQSITTTTEISKSFGDSAFSLSATSTSGGAITYSTSTTNICSVNAATGLVQILLAGTCTITATQNGVGNAYASASATITVTIAAVTPLAPAIKSAYVNPAGFADGKGQLIITLQLPTSLGGASTATYNASWAGTALTCVTTDQPAGTARCTSSSDFISFATDIFSLTEDVAVSTSTTLTSSLVTQSMTVYRPDPGAPQDVSSTLTISSGTITSKANWKSPQSSGDTGSSISSYKVSLYKGATKVDEYVKRVVSPEFAASVDNTASQKNYTEDFGKRYIWGTVRENGSLNFTAPSGYVFSAIAFASYGLPTTASDSSTVVSVIAPTTVADATPPDWRFGSSCHATTSLQKLQDELAKSNTSIAISATNGVFGDPCSGTGKTLAVAIELAPTVQLLLDSGTQYRLEVTATNSAGLSRTMASSFVTPTVPADVQLLTGTASNGKVNLSWSAPLTNGGSSVTQYVVSSVTTSGNVSTGTIAIDGTTAEITGLTNGTNYTFTVKAVNAIGQSTGVSLALTPFTVSSAPTSVATTSSNNTLTVTWAAPASTNGSAITHYQAVLKNTSANVASCSVVVGATLSCTFTNLVPTDYTVDVFAYNAAGASVAATSTPALTIAAISNPIAFRTQKSGDATSQSVVGNAITVDYDSSPVTIFATSTSGVTPSLSVATASASICEISTSNVVTIKSYSIAGSTQTCLVNAITAEPTGSLYANASTTLTITVNALPTNAPTGVTITLSGNDVTVNWSAPTYVGGAPVSSYTVKATSSSGTKTITSNTTSATFTGSDALALDTSHVITVKANNGSSGNDSATSNLSSSVTLIAVPVAPTGLKVTKDADIPGKALIEWTAPAGSSVTSYSVSVKLTASPNTEVGSCSTTATSCVISGIPAGSYTVSLFASNQRGDGAATTTTVEVGLTQSITFSNASGETITAASLPFGSSTTKLFATTSIGTPVTFAVTAGSDYCSISGNDLTIKSFTAATGTSVTCTVTASASGNTTHLSASSNFVVTINLKKPDAPKSVELIPGNNKITVSWQAPPSNGGAALTKYRIYYSSKFTGSTPNFPTTVGTTQLDGLIETSDTATLTLQITGLVNGYTYAVKVSAINAVGEGELDPITVPAGNPGQVANGTVTGSDRLVTVQWKAAQDVTTDGVTTYGNGGSEITGFEVRVTNADQGTFTCSVSPTSSQLANQATVFECAVSVPVNKVAYTVTVITTTAAGSSTTNLGNITPVATQTISVTSPSSLDETVTQFNYGSTYQINASASSGLALTFTSSNTARCTVSSTGLVTAVAVGDCDIAISQSGNDIFNAATSRTKKFTILAIVSPSKPTVSAITTSGATFSATLSWGGSDLTPTFVVCTTAATPVCADYVQSVIGSTSSAALSYAPSNLTPDTSYTVALKAVSASGTTVTSATQAFTTLKTPVITNSITTFDALSSYSIQLAGDAATGTGNFSTWSVSSGSLPAGLSLDSNTGVISGTVTTTGDFTSAISSSFTIQVTDSGGNTGTKVFNITIQGASQNLSIADIDNRSYSTSTISPIVSAPNGATLVFATSTSTICTINSSTGVITMLRDGTCTLSVSSAAFGSYRSGTASESFVISKATQTVSFAEVSAQTYSPTGTFDVLATATSGLAPSYSTSTASVCTVNSSTGVVSIIAAGTCSLSATQTPTGDNANKFDASNTATVDVVIAKATPTILMTSASSIAYKDKLTVTATISGGGSLSLVSGDTSKLSVSGVEIEALTGSGTVTLTLNSAASDNYLAGTRTVTINLVRAAQTINTYTLADQTYMPDKEITLGATSTSTLPVTYTSSDSSLAVIDGTKLTIKGAGTVTITMSQAGDSNQYLPAPEKTTTLVISKAIQTISLTGFPTSAIFGDARRKLTASNVSEGSSNGRAVTLRTTTSDICSIDEVTGNSDAELNGTFLVILGVGNCTITGANAGDSNYESKTQSFTVAVAKAVRTVTVSTTPAIPSPPPLTITYLNEEVELSVSTLQDDNDAKSFTTTGPCTIVGSKLTSTGAGTCVVTATVAEGGRYLSGVQTFNVVVNRAAQTITNVIRGKEINRIKAPDLPAGASSFSVASVDVLVGSEVTKGATDAETTVLVRLEVVMTDPKAVKPADIDVLTTVSGRVVSTIAALTKNVLPDRELVVIESERTSNQTISVAAPGLPEGADSFTIASNKSIGDAIQVGDVVAVLNPIGTGTFDPINVVATTAGKVTSAVAASTTGLLGSATVAVLEPALKIGSTLAIKATKGSGSSPLVYTSTTPATCSVAADSYGVQRITGIELGDCVIRISQAQDSNYLATFVEDRILVARGDQAVVVKTVEVIKFSDAPAPIEVQAATGASIEIKSDNIEVAKYQSGKIVPTGVGEVLFAISASGTDRFNAAPTLTRLVVVEKGEQTISLTIPTSGTEGEIFDVKSSASSLLPVEVASLTPLICLIDKGKLKLITPGDCRVSAIQEGSELWEAAPSIIQLVKSQAKPNSSSGGGPMTPEQIKDAEANAQRAEEKLKALEERRLAREEASKKAAAEAAAKAAEKQQFEVERATRVQILDPVRTSTTQELPIPETGKSVLLFDGREVTVGTFTTNQNILGFTARGLTTTIGTSPNSSNLRNLTSNNLLNAVEGDYIVIGGTKFKPDSIVTVWAFSKPILLGQIKTDAAGSYAGALPLPKEISAGNHSIQINGVVPDGRIHSLTVGIKVEPAPKAPVIQQKSIRKTVLFGARTSTLDRAEQKLIASYRSLLVSGAKVSCIAYFGKTTQSKAEASLNRSRAQAACAYLIPKKPSAYSISTVPLSKAPKATRAAASKPSRVDITITLP